MTQYITSPPRVIKEEVLAVRGGWLIKARICLYHDRVRRSELYLENDKNVQEVGWTLEDIAQLHQMLSDFISRNKDLV